MTIVSAGCSRRSSSAEVRVLSLLKISGHFLNARLEVMIREPRSPTTGPRTRPPRVLDFLEEIYQAIWEAYQEPLLDILVNHKTDEPPDGTTLDHEFTDDTDDIPF